MYIFVVIDCKDRKNILITKSARGARDRLYIGSKIEVWSKSGTLIETIYFRNINKICKYVRLEKQFIGKKQAKAEQRNKAKSK